MKKLLSILPSAVTSGNLVFGCLSILASVNGNFLQAALLLIGAMLCDTLDGRVARLTHCTSEIGAELDSLSDLVSFGMAPAFMIYLLDLNTLGKLGIAIAVVYVLCGGLRLARFNVKAKDGIVHAYFEGLPIPAAAGLLLSFVLTYEMAGPTDLTFKTLPILRQTLPFFFNSMAVLMVCLAFLMVSTIPYYSFKKMEPAVMKRRAAAIILPVIVFAVFVYAYPQNAFFIAFLIYVLSGPVNLCVNLLLHRSPKASDEAEIAVVKN
jgi:CDP-diacylglycerol--serine O-phosphatidyltransferase